MEIRDMRRADAPLLFWLISELPPHGHRNWQVADSVQLDAMLSESRIDPNKGAWSLAFDGGFPCGYSLIEPELNIGRVVIGCAVTGDREELHARLLSDAVDKGFGLSGIGNSEIHIAVQENEPPYVNRNIAEAGFSPVRRIFKMRCSVDGLTTGDDANWRLGNMSVELIDLESDKEFAALTRLHNCCFEGSWGFSPNTVAEIKERVNNDYERTRVAPILLMRQEGLQDPVAYVWTTLSETVGRIEMIGVSPAYRGTGIGRSLFKAGVRHLIDHGASSIDLEVDAENEAAVTLYESAGLAVYSRTTFHACVS